MIGGNQQKRVGPLQAADEIVEGLVDFFKMSSRARVLGSGDVAEGVVLGPVGIDQASPAAAAGGGDLARQALES